jgi:glycine/D-amino acid oxidase-like deaminating enzyme
MIFEHDIVVIGAGMAGASIAAHLSEHASVRLLEMEPTPGFHSDQALSACAAPRDGTCSGSGGAIAAGSRNFGARCWC